MYFLIRIVPYFVCFSPFRIDCRAKKSMEHMMYRTNAMRVW